MGSLIFMIKRNKYIVTEKYYENIKCKQVKKPKLNKNVMK